MRNPIQEKIQFTVDPSESAVMSGRFANDLWFPNLLNFSNILGQAEVVEIPAGYRTYPLPVIEAPNPDSPGETNPGGVVNRDISITIQEMTAYPIHISTQISALANHTVQALVDRVGEAIGRRILYEMEVIALRGGGSASVLQGIIGTTGVHTDTTYDNATKVFNSEEVLLNAGVRQEDITYVTSPTMYEVLRTLGYVASGHYPLIKDGRIIDHPIIPTPQLVGNTGVIGDFSKAVIARFGDPIITVDNLTQMGIIRYHLEMDWDYKVVYPTAFQTVTG